MPNDLCTVLEMKGLNLEWYHSKLMRFEISLFLIDYCIYSFFFYTLSCLKGTLIVWGQIETFYGNVLYLSLYTYCFTNTHLKCMYILTTNVSYLLTFNLVTVQPVFHCYELHCSQYSVCTTKHHPPCYWEKIRWRYIWGRYSVILDKGVPERGLFVERDCHKNDLSSVCSVWQLGKVVQ